jgi:hypothetical protein
MVEMARRLATILTAVRGGIIDVMYTVGYRSGMDEAAEPSWAQRYLFVLLLLVICPAATGDLSCSPSSNPRLCSVANMC